MKIPSLLLQAKRNLFAHRLRSLLALLGILTGSASIVALQTSGTLARAEALSAFQGFGTHLMTVSFTRNPKDAATEPISPHIFKTLFSHIPEIRTIAPYVMRWENLYVQGKMYSVLVIGGEYALFQHLKLALKEGSASVISYSDERWAFLGASLQSRFQKEGIFPVRYQKIEMGDEVYRISGWFQPWRQGFFYGDIDNALFVPLKYVWDPMKMSRVEALIELHSHHAITETIQKIEDTLKRHFKNTRIQIQSPEQVVLRMKAQGKILSLFLFSMGLISLITGSIGVLNVMLVSVSEREEEIGIRKAVGASARDIQYLFLAEALILSVLGGVSGSVIGVIASLLIAKWSGWNFQIVYAPICVGIFASVICGVLSGWYPAKRAASFNAARCLRGI